VWEKVANPRDKRQGLCEGQKKNYKKKTPLWGGRKGERVPKPSEGRRFTKKELPTKLIGVGGGGALGPGETKRRGVLKKFQKKALGLAIRKGEKYKFYEGGKPRHGVGLS